MNGLMNIIISYGEEAGWGVALWVSVFLSGSYIYKNHKTRAFGSVICFNVGTVIAIYADMFLLAIITFIGATVFLMRSLWGSHQKKILRQEVDYMLEQEIEEALRGAMLDSPRAAKAYNDDDDDYMIPWGDMTVPMPTAKKDKRWMKNILKY